jgi:hypothetical protein
VAWPPSSGTVSELLKRWFENSSADFSPSTVLETTGFIRGYIEPGLGPYQVARLRTEDIDRLYGELRKRGGKNGKPLAPATVRRAHVIVHRALEQAVRWGWIRTNPAHQAQVPRTPAPDIHPPAPCELVRLFALAQEADPGFATFLGVAAATPRQPRCWPNTVAEPKRPRLRAMLSWHGTRMCSATSPIRQRLGGPIPPPAPSGCWSSAPARPVYAGTTSGTTLQPGCWPRRGRAHCGRQARPPQRLHNPECLCSLCTGRRRRSCRRARSAPGRWCRSRGEPLYQGDSSRSHKARLAISAR